MKIDKNNVTTQDELNEQAPIDRVEERVEAKMKKLEGNAKKSVADGLQNNQLAREGERLKKQGESDLRRARGKD
ncbi:MAG TPA: hypothetical protein VGQ39_24405 [Pyrinomonadaceae bacterium]|jgi:uncharacterized protein YjbJ (UPF0337 family)|nr:hypothetical protein [Pyrinomonadaceae bacterium]